MVLNGFRGLNTNKIITDTITDYKTDEDSGDLVIWKIHSEKLTDGQSIHTRVRFGAAYFVIIGTRLTSNRGRYIVLSQTNDTMNVYRIGDANISKTVFTGEVTSIAIT